MKFLEGWGISIAVFAPVVAAAIMMLMPKKSEEAHKWLALGAGTFAAHAATVVLKRIVRRPRPHDPRVKIGVKTPSQLSFPSSHAANTGAAAAHLADITGRKWPWLLVPVMMLSRNVLGVHYPTDTLAGAALGAATAKVAIEAEKRI